MIILEGHGLSNYLLENTYDFVISVVDSTIGTLTNITAGDTHAEIIAQINEGSATVDPTGPSVTITPTLFGVSDPAVAGETITFARFVYAATGAATVVRDVAINLTVAAVAGTANTSTNGASTLTWDGAARQTGTLQDGRSYIVLPAGETINVTGVTPVPTTLDGGFFAGGSQINPTRVANPITTGSQTATNFQGYDARFSVGSVGSTTFNAALSATYPATLSAWDTVVVQIPSPMVDGSARNGLSGSYGTFLILPEAPNAGTIYDSPVKYAGQTSLRAFDLDFTALQATLPYRAGDPISSLDTTAAMDMLDRDMPISGQNTLPTGNVSGYEAFWPQRDIDDRSNYGANLNYEFGVLKIMFLQSADPILRARILLYFVRIGLDFENMILSGLPITVGGGHPQYLIDMVATAYWATGRSANIDELANIEANQTGQIFVVDQAILDGMVPHNDLAGMHFARQRTIPTGGVNGMVIELPTQRDGDGSGDPSQVSFVNMYLIRPSDGARALIVSQTVAGAGAGDSTTNIGQSNSLLVTIDAQPSPAFAAADVVATEPFEIPSIGTYEWRITKEINSINFAAQAVYRTVNDWTANAIWTRELGFAPSTGSDVLRPFIEYLKRSNATNTPVGDDLPPHFDNPYAEAYWNNHFYTLFPEETPPAALNNPFTLDGYVSSPSSLGSDVTAMRFTVRLQRGATAFSGTQHLGGSSGDFQTLINEGAVYGLMEDSTNSVVSSTNGDRVGIQNANPMTITHTGDLVAGTHTVEVNGDVRSATPSANTGLMRSRKAVGNTNASGNFSLPTDVLYEFFRWEVQRTGNPGVWESVKELSVAEQGSLANVQADAYVSGNGTIVGIPASLSAYPFDAARDEGTDGDWFVNGAVTSSGDGTSVATPFKTVQEAANVASAGEVVSILEHAGKYRETLTLTNISGADGSRIVFKGHGTGKPEITAFEELTGWVPADAGDQAVLGNVDRANVEKIVGITKASFPNGDPIAMNLHEGKKKINIARLASPERDIPELLGDTETFVSVQTTTFDDGGDAMIDYWTLTAEQSAGFIDGATIGPVYAVVAPNVSFESMAVWDATSMRLTPVNRLGRYESNELKDSIAIFNVPGRLREGEFAFIDQGTTVDLYIKGRTGVVEHSARGRVVDLSEGTIAANHIEFRSLKLTGASSATTNPADRFYILSGGGGAGGNAGIVLRNMYLGQCERFNGGYGPIDLARPTGLRLEGVVIEEAIGQSGMFIRGTTGNQAGDGWTPAQFLLDQVMVIKASHSPFRFYSSRDSAAIRLTAVLCALDAHANKGNLYEQGSNFIFGWSDFDSVKGYLTCQETDGFGLWMVAGTQSYNTISGNFGRAFAAQNSSLHDFELSGITGTWVDEEDVTWTGGTGLVNDRYASNNSVFGANGIRVRLNQDQFPAVGDVITTTNGYSGTVVSVVGTKNSPAHFDNVANRPPRYPSFAHFTRFAPYAPVSADNADSFTIGQPGSFVLWEAFGNLAHGYEGCETAQITAWDYNMSTATDLAIGDGLGLNDYLASANADAEPASMYVDYEHGNFEYASNSPVRTQKVSDQTATVAALKLRFPDVPDALWDQDINGDPFDPADAYFGSVQNMAVGGVNAVYRRVKRPTLSNGGAIGDTLTCDIGFVTAFPWPAFGFQWQRSQDVTSVDIELIGLDNLVWTDIAGETTDNYVLALADVDTRVRCVVTATGDAVIPEFDAGAVSYGATSTAIIEAFPIAAPVELVRGEIPPSVTEFETATFAATAGKALLVVSGIDNASDTTNVVTIGAASRTVGTGDVIPEAHRRRRSNDMVSMHFIAAPTGGAAVTVQVSSASTMDHGWVVVYEVDGATGVGAVDDTALTGQTATLDVTSTVPGSSILFASVLSVSTETCTWTGVTEIFDEGSPLGSQGTGLSIGHTEAASVNTYTAVPAWTGSSGSIALIGVELLP